jgi:NAD(P)H-dependent flavin oxidoreductase YrpB (nitropropane dioxygenase family)
LQLAGLGGGIGTPELAVAVARTGGLGVVGFGSPVAGLAGAAPGKLGANFLVPFLDRAAVELAASAVHNLDFFWGDPDASLVALAHGGGALASWQVGSVDEARAAQDAGCDFITAQGVEAGGHVRGTTPLSELLPRVLAAVDIPVLAAGGIATAADVRRVLDAGADGVRVGTRFVAAEESGAHRDYVAALIAAGGDDTELTTKFEVGWPDAPHRVLRSCIAAAEGNEPASSPRWLPSPPLRETQGDVSAMALYAGRGVGAVSSEMSAAAIVAELMAVS